MRTLNPVGSTHPWSLLPFGGCQSSLAYRYITLISDSVIPQLFSPCGSVSSPLLIGDTGLIEGEPLPWLDYIHTDPVSKLSYTNRYWGLGLQYSFGGAALPPITHTNHSNGSSVLSCHKIPKLVSTFWCLRHETSTDPWCPSSAPNGVFRAPLIASEVRGKHLRPTHVHFL